jgi:LysM repeat protein
MALLALLAAPAAAATCKATYVVKAGDTLRKIGEVYGVTWQELATANAIPNPNLIYIGQVLCIPGTAPAPSVQVPTFTIVSVVPNQSVTIRTSNFPANQTFNVTMGPIGTQGINGTSAGSTNSGSGGSFTATYNIPSGLRGSFQISIRLQSPSGYYSYNWFYNTAS